MEEELNLIKRNADVLLAATKAAGSEVNIQ
jgi:hypothetical protein